MDDLIPENKRQATKTNKWGQATQNTLNKEAVFFFVWINSYIHSKKNKKFKTSGKNIILLSEYLN